jgi:hypothetical protein
MQQTPSRPLLPQQDQSQRVPELKLLSASVWINNNNGRMNSSDYDDDDDDETAPPANKLTVDEMLLSGLKLLGWKEERLDRCHSETNVEQHGGTHGAHPLVVAQTCEDLHTAVC